MGFNTENPNMLLVSIFYIVVGIMEVGYFAIEISAAPPHIAILGIVSLVTAYTIFKTNKWSVLLTAALFVTGITFAATTLNASIITQTFGGAILFHLALIAYIILQTLAFIYILKRRE